MPPIADYRTSRLSINYSDPPARNTLPKALRRVANSAAFLYLIYRTRLNSAPGKLLPAYASNFNTTFKRRAGVSVKVIVKVGGTKLAFIRLVKLALKSRCR